MESYQSGKQKSHQNEDSSIRRLAFYQLSPLPPKIDTLGKISCSSRISEFEVHLKNSSRNQKQANASMTQSCNNNRQCQEVLFTTIRTSHQGENGLQYLKGQKTGMQQKSKVAIETKNFCMRSTEQKSFITKTNLRNRRTPVQSAKEMKYKPLSTMGVGRHQSCVLQYQRHPSLIFSVPTPNRNYLAVFCSQRNNN